MDRAATLRRLRSGTFDVVVIGGGIVGAAVARDAVLRDLSVALLERRDFASGTSSRTSKLVHGGLRYLRQGRVRLVRQALVERDRLYRQEPRLVKAVRFYLPVYGDRGPGKWLTRFGLWLYGTLARDRELSGRAWVAPRHLGYAEPALAASGLRGAGTFHDCLVRDARLVVEVVKSAVAAGALAANYVEATGFEKRDGRIVAVHARDVETGESFPVKGRTFLNATGVWADAVRALDDPRAPRLVRPTRGVHVLVPRERVGNEHGVALASVRDGRAVFVLPWGRHTLVGTTDTDDPGDPDGVRATAADVDYLLETVNAHFPAARLGREDVAATYAGLRPLVGGSPGEESDISRAHEVERDPSGLYTILGGKLTTHRAMAEEVVDRMARELRRQNRPVGPCRTRTEPLRRDAMAPEAFRALLRDLGLDADIAVHLADTFASGEILPLLRSDARMRERLVPGLPYVAAEVAHAVRAEAARTVEDVLARRTAILLEAPRHGEECLDRVTGAMAAELGWGEGERHRQGEAYLAAVARSLAFREEAHA